MTILVADDDATGRRLARVALEAEGHVVLEAGDGAAALALLERQPVDAIISDVLMPRMDGYRFCYQVRQRERLHAIPFIIYTATFTSPGDARLAREVGADYYLKKAVPVSALVETVHEVAARGRASGPPAQPPLEQLRLVQEYNEFLIRKLEEKNLELRRHAEALQHSEVRDHLLAAIVESSDDAIVAKTLDGVITSWNGGAERLYGFTAAEATGHSIDRIMPPDRREEWRELVNRLRRGESVQHFETARQTKDGRTIEVSLSLSPIKDSHGAMVGAAAIAHDVTARRAAERQIRLQASLLNQLRNAVVALNLDGRIRYWNKHAETLFQWNSDEVLDRHIIEVVPPSHVAAADEILRHLLESGFWEGEFPVCRKDGTEFPVHLAAALLRNEQRRATGFVCVFVDIIERKRFEAKLSLREQTEAQLRALTTRLQSIREEESSRIARDIHDELGQALTSLNLDVAWFQEQAGHLTVIPVRTPLLERIRSMAGLLENTVRAVQRICSELRPQMLDSLGLAATIEWQAAEFEKRTGIRTRFQPPLEPVRLTQEQATAVFRIFQEILNNVIRHAQAKHLTISLIQDRTGSRLEVTDDGRGISTAEIADPKSLGLLGMRERALSVGAQLEIHGLPGKGTAVAVRVPLPPSANWATTSP